MIDIGVASPSAQGQAMISTATAATIACASAGRRSRDEPSDEREHRANHYCRNEIARHDVGQALNRRAAPLGVGHHPHDLREQRIGADPLGAHHEAAAGVDGGADDAVARTLEHRDRLAGEHRFVDRAFALDNHAVDRNVLARAHAQPIANLDLAQRDVSSTPLSRSRRAVFGASLSRARIAPAVWLRARNSST